MYSSLYLFVRHPQLSRLHAAIIAGAASFGLIDLTIGQGAFAAIVALCSAAGAAYLASRPALMQARIAQKQLSDAEAQTNFVRQAQLHTEVVKFLQSRIEYNGRREALSRKSKHNALGELQRVTAYVYE